MKVLFPAQLVLSLLVNSTKCLAKSELRPGIRGLNRKNHHPIRKKSNNKLKNTLIASLYKYPEYSGELDITGIITVRFDDDGSFLFHIDARGLEKSTAGGVHIHEGTACEYSDLVGGHYWHDGRTDDNWTREGGAVWATDENGNSISSFRLFNGYGRKRNTDHAVVIHDSDGTRAACGILKPNNFVLSAEIGAYPPYDGNSGLKNLSVGGEVKLYFDADGHFEMHYDLAGLQKRCSDCGVHVHTGTTCENHADVGGHYFTDTAGDLWTASGGAVYNSNRKRNAKGLFSLFDGYSFTEHVNHAVIVHAKGGERIGCGILNIEDKYGKTT